MLSNLLFEYAIASKKCDISRNKIEIVLVSSGHTDSKLLFYLVNSFILS